MWIFTNQAFLSVVEHRDDPGLLLVRARFKGDIERVFPDAVVRRTSTADYLFRAIVTRDAFARALVVQADRIDYDNFKNSVGAAWRKAVYSLVWSVMFRAQGDRAGRKGGAA